jgi:C_GCAxxG_C_C family probable redox protein
VLLSGSVTDYQDKAEIYFQEGYTGSQSILLTMQDYWQVEDRIAPKIACAFGSGIGHRGSLCGVISGGVIAIGEKFGTNNPRSEERRQAYAIALKFYNRFVDDCGSAMCRKLIGYDLTNPDELAAARQSEERFETCIFNIRKGIEILINLYETS